MNTDNLQTVITKFGYYTITLKSNADSMCLHCFFYNEHDFFSLISIFFVLVKQIIEVVGAVHTVEVN